MQNTRPCEPRQSLRLPGDLVQKLVQRAKKNDRSFNKEVKHLIEAALEAEEFAQQKSA
jgi:hypothetical protein